MAITPASGSLSDAEITDAIGRGDLGSALRLWVRHWPAALASARQYVERPEVPGLAAEALIGTISVIAIGRGPREDVTSFVAAAVQELGEDDEPVVIDAGDPHPDVFASIGLTRAFADLSVEDQDALRSSEPDEDAERSLTVLQTSYLTTHLDEAPSRECRPAHIALIAAAEGSASDGFPGSSWLHLSHCAWCTEAFHEIAFSSSELDLLVDPAVMNFVAPVPSVRAARRGTRRAVLRGGRSRLIVAGAGTAAVALIAVVLSQTLTQNDDAARPAAAPAGAPTALTTADHGSTTSYHPSSGPSIAMPTGSVQVAGPLKSPTKTRTKAPTPTQPASSPTHKPTKHPTTTPSTSAPSPSPTPPAPTPTKTCNPLQHVLGFC